MRAMTAAACGALGLMLLTGCSKNGGQATNTANGAHAAATAPASGPDTAITAPDMPHLKAGYWDSVSTTNGGTPETEHFCSSGKPLTLSKTAGHGCGVFSFKRTLLGAIVIDTACAEGPIASKMHMTASGDFNSSYTTDGQISLTMQGKPAQTMTTHTVSHWVGACPAGEAPEDE